MHSHSLKLHDILHSSIPHPHLTEELFLVIVVQRQNSLWDVLCHEANVLLRTFLHDAMQHLSYDFVEEMNGCWQVDRELGIDRDRVLEHCADMILVPLVRGVVRRVTLRQIWNEQLLISTNTPNAVDYVEPFHPPEEKIEVLRVRLELVEAPFEHVGTYYGKIAK